MKTSLSQASILLGAANLILLLACVIFASGFFPYKPFLSGLAEYKTSQWGSPPKAQFDKVVFMVVDALRSDFVFGNDSGFTFTQSLIRRGSALPFTAHATAPTITMPRLKAITTGSIPSFLDMILNFAESDTTSSLAYQDTWLAQMKAKRDGKLIMYGDDTWLKLFPSTFNRSDGTSSFFVSDFTEVDNNVTRHVPSELKNDDWNVMIMHYLGMDHIGHKSGPRSINMPPKQQEMDGIVEQIYTAISTYPHHESTLFVLCGDHGMNDGGNHGGSAPGETSPALVFLSPKFSKISKGLSSPIMPRNDFNYYTTVEQSDIAPTLAALLGFPTPLNNLGVFIPQFLPMWSTDRDRIQILLQNAVQMLDIVKATFPHALWDNPKADIQCTGSLSSADKLACAWREVSGTFRASQAAQPPAEMILPFLVYFCKTAQELLSSTASNYNLPHMFLGTVLAGSSVAMSMYSLLKVLNVRISPWFFGIIAGYGVMMFASSYVEEEHHFWYWTCSSWLVYLAFARQRKTNLLENPRSLLIAPLPLLCLRLLRRWNQSGQKYAGAPDIVAAFRSSTSLTILLWILVLSTYTHLYTRLAKMFRQAQLPILIGHLWAAAICTVSFAFKVAFTWNDEPELVQSVAQLLPIALRDVLLGVGELDLVGTARLAFMCIGVAFVYVVMMHLSSAGTASRPLLVHQVLPLLTALLLLQTRLTNIPTFLLFEILRLTTLSPSSPSSPTPKPTSTSITPPTSPPAPTPTPASHTLTTLLLAHVSYFALGGTNAISSLDLSLAYNGIASYNAQMVGLLLFLGNWAGPVWFSVAGLGSVVALSGKGGGKIGDPATASDETTKKSITAASTKDLTPPTSTPSPTSPASPSTSAYLAYLRHTTLLTLHISTTTLSTMFACAALRTHLFVWTVFSPKFLYAVAWLVGWHGFVGLGVGWGLVALG